MNLSGYFDYNATTPLSERVREEMTQVMGLFANPSSKSRAATELRERIAETRRLFLQLLKAPQGELYFTSGGTESNNLAIKGILHRRMPKPGHIISSAIEHPSVLETIRHLCDGFGFTHTLVEPDGQGVVSVADVAKAVTGDTQLISLMMANNETGAIQPVAEVGRMAEQRGIPFCIDGVQGVGKLDIDLSRIPCTALSFSSHKFYGPKGVGGLWIKDAALLTPLLHGGGQESGLRGGTENVIGIIGMGAAAWDVLHHQEDWRRQQRRLKALLLTELRRLGVSVRLNGPQDEALQSPNTLNLSFAGVRGEALSMLLEHRHGIAVSIGSACSNNKQTRRSHVLKAMGLSDARIDSALRISFGRFTEEQDIHDLAEAISHTVIQLQALSGGLPTEAA